MVEYEGVVEEKAGNTRPADSGRIFRWLVGSFFILLLASVGWLLFHDTPKVQAADGAALDCVTCHPRELTYHDQLGTGSQACYSCHDTTQMGEFHVVNGSVIQREDSNQLCGQCHQSRYNSWKEGTHGIAGTVAAVGCVACHDPHNPQVTFQNITKPPLKAPNSVPPPPQDWAIILAISIGLLFTGAVVLTRRKANA